MRENKHFEEFGKPFPASDVSWRMQYVDKTRLEGFAVPYLDARAVADRLDEVVGQNRWKDSYEKWHNDSQLCTIYIYDDELKEWIGKTDGAENTDVEPVKGGLSDAFKRTAVKWNIGRYLYSFEPVWVKARQQGKSYVIDNSEIPKLNDAYNRKAAELFGINNTVQQSKVKPQMQKEQVPPKSNASQKSTSSAPVFEITNIRTENGDSGSRSTMILANGGKQYRAFMNARDERLRQGIKITNIKSEKVSNSYGNFIMLNSYDIAA